jgi:hypothetical protein
MLNFIYVYICICICICIHVFSLKSHNLTKKIIIINRNERIAHKYNVLHVCPCIHPHARRRKFYYFELAQVGRILIYMYMYMYMYICFFIKITQPDKENSNYKQKQNNHI